MGTTGSKESRKVYWISELIPILGIVFVIGVPVTALAAHFVLRPLVRDITTAILSGGRREAGRYQRRREVKRQHYQHPQDLVLHADSPPDSLR